MILREVAQISGDLSFIVTPSDLSNTPKVTVNTLKVSINSPKVSINSPKVFVNTLGVISNNLVLFFLPCAILVRPDGLPVRTGRTESSLLTD